MVAKAAFGDATLRAIIDPRPAEMINSK